MKSSFTLQITRAAALCVLLTGISGGALAQTTGSISPKPAAAKSATQQPRGSCMPIGLTASGEMVFPFSCKDIVEQRRAKDAEQKSAASQEKPAATENKPVVKAAEAAAPPSGQPPSKPAEEATLPLPKALENELRGHAMIPGCTHFRSYDPASGTYRGYDGQRRSCRQVGVLSTK